MKRYVIFFFMVCLTGFLFGQEKPDTTYWKKSGDFTLSFNQVSFSNWAAGGKNSVSGVSFFNYMFNFLKARTSWDNSLNLGYGLLKESDRDLTKSEAKFSAMFSLTPDPVVLTRLSDGVIVDVSVSGAAFFGVKVKMFKASPTGLP